MIIDLVLCSGTSITTATIQIMVCSHCLIPKATWECHFVKNMRDSSGYWWHPIRITYQLSLASVTTTATTTILNGFVVPRIFFNKDNWLEVQVIESEVNEL
jgi:hypothetical protein